jgi:serine/threonine-protein kinase
MQWLNDRYRLDTLIGRGGMAVVWRAYDAVLRRVVAVKMLPDRSVDARSRRRLRDEAHAAARLSHPAIANVYDYGEAWVGWRRRTPFLVMEYVDGPTLADRLAAGALPWSEAVRICADVAAALAFAHANELVHRDVKPANVMLSPSGVKVVDFGIASASGHHQVDADGVIFGTRAYMAPEQAADVPAAPSGDVYALGLLLYECLTGTRSGWVTDSGPTVPDGPGSDHAVAMPPCVPALSELVPACLSADPALRPTSAEVAETLRRAVGAAAWPLATIRAGTPWEDRPTVARNATADGDRPWHRARLFRTRSTPDVRQRSVSLPQAAFAAASAAAVAITLALQLPGAASSEGVPSVMPPPDSPNGQSATDCTTRFSARYLADGTFTALLDLTYTGLKSLSAWSVRFTLPDGQHLIGADRGRWTQNDATVTITTNQSLFPGQTVSVALHGTASDHEDPPRSFALDGHTCSKSATDLEATRSVTVPGPIRTVREPRGQQARQPATSPSGKMSSKAAPTDPTPSDPTPTDPPPSQPDPPPSQPDPPPSQQPDPPPSSAPSDQPEPSTGGSQSGTDGPPPSGTAQPSWF